MRNVYSLTAVYKKGQLRPMDMIFYDQDLAEQTLSECINKKREFKLIMFTESTYEMYLRMRAQTNFSDGSRVYLITVENENGESTEFSDLYFTSARKLLWDVLRPLTNTVVKLVSKSILGSDDGVVLYSREIKHKE